MFILTASLLSTAVYSQPDRIIKGRVFSQDGQPIANVKVEVVDATLVTHTLDNGTFSLKELEREKILLLFTHPDYKPLSLEVSSEQKVGKMIEVVLTAKNPMLMTIREEVTVSAEADSIIDVNLPSHRTILPASVLEEMGSSNVAEAVEKVPGVAMVGKGGYSMVPAIRGLAEHRILLLVDGIRITSERRIGASGSFINLNNLDHIEVNRGPYSVFFGSGAVGGIINIITKAPEAYAPLKGDFHLSYNTIRKERAGSANISGSFGKFGYILGVNGKKADNYKAPSGVIEQSRYSDYDLLMRINREGENSELHLTLFHYKGTDIGKPSPTARLKPRWYPGEQNTLFTMRYKVENKRLFDTLDASFYVFHSTLETQKENLRETLSLEKRNLARVEGTNLGFKIRANKNITQDHTLNFGIDFFGRDNINDSNTEWTYDENGLTSSKTDETSLRDAQRGNFGLFLDDKINISSSLSLNLGARFDLLKTSNLTSNDVRTKKSDEAFIAYIGTEFFITPRLSILANLGRSFRFPSISELFYSGLTGRGTVFGNPDLDPEKSLNLDLGFRYLHEKFFVSIYGFHNVINDMIQKYPGAADEEYFYRNMTQGRIFGIEGEFYMVLAKNLELFVNFHHMKGREKDTATYLNYIPPSRLTLWTKFSPGCFWIEPKITFQAAKKNPGPLEIEIDGFTLFDTILGCKLSPNITLLAVIQNILNQAYRFSADEKGVDAPARGIVLRTSISF
jgi:iron complex outermembrane receptor protein